MTIDGPNTRSLRMICCFCLKVNINSKDIVLSTDVTIFATSKSSIKQKGPYNAHDDRETGMMATK